jgi:hypothetical protein
MLEDKLGKVECKFHGNVILMHPQTPCKTQMQIRRWKQWKKKELGYAT